MVRAQEKKMVTHSFILGFDATEIDKSSKPLYSQS
jgi:hypothetical protein